MEELKKVVLSLDSKDKAKENRKYLTIILLSLAGLLLACGIAFLVFKLITGNEAVEELEEDLEEDFEDDFFENEEE